MSCGMSRWIGGIHWAMCLPLWMPCCPGRFPRRRSTFWHRKLPATGRIPALPAVSWPPQAQRESAIDHLKRALAACKCSRTLKEEDFLIKDWADLEDADLAALDACGYQHTDCEKLCFDAHDAFGSAYFLELGLPRQQLEARIPSLFTDAACGRVLRVKGFVRDAGGWVELNATADGLTAAPHSGRAGGAHRHRRRAGPGTDRSCSAELRERAGNTEKHRFAVHRPGRSRRMGVRSLPGPFLFHSFSGKIQQSLSDIAVAPPEVLGYNFDLAVRRWGFFTIICSFARILAFCFLGEVCHAVLPLPVPASVYGLVLLLLALNFRLIRLEDVKEVGVFLTGIFPLLFVPAAAGVMELWAEMGEMLLPIIIAIIPVTVLVMVTAGKTTQALTSRKKNKETAANDGIAE